jgi:arylsulfate sulfotransferase
MIECSRSGQGFSSRYAFGRGTASLVCLLACFLVAGCSATIRNLDPSTSGPSPTPPSGPPPTTGQAGSVMISPQVIALAPGQSYQFTATVSGGGQAQWFVNGTSGGSGSTGTVDSTGKYTAPGSISQSENVTVTVALAGSTQQNYATAVVSIIVPGAFTCPFQLGSPLVARYSVYLPAPGKASVEFGKTTSYGRDTWQVHTPTANGGEVNLYVAGMEGQTLYHMRGQIVLDDGATFTDADQTCNTTVPPVTAQVQVSSSGTPAPGIEMWNTLLPSGYTQAFATDLQGNVIWTYDYSHSQGDLIQGFQLLPNGNMLMTISYLSSITAPQGTGIYNEIREVDLAGNTVESLTMDQLNQKLAAGHFLDGQGNVYKLGSFHHDVLALPNGHLVMLATYYRTYSNVAGISTSGPINVTGDAVVDVDQNLNPDWVWNTFDHPNELSIDRHPMNFLPASHWDWTHSNNMLYSADDHNLLLSMRHQNWIIKINFLDGTGSGQVMWRLGYQGDFTLVDPLDSGGGSNPANWFYAQHGMNYFTPNTTGVFRLGLMDNGNDRVFASGQVQCVPYGAPKAQCYSTMPVLEINENNRTATMITHYSPGSKYFSFFGGNAELLSNNDMEVDFCATTLGGFVQELDPQGKPLVWQGFTAKADQYHAYRLPSLYPGVQW